jgi:hypothetical protein
VFIFILFQSFFGLALQDVYCDKTATSTSTATTTTTK